LKPFLPPLCIGYVSHDKPIPGDKTMSLIRYQPINLFDNYNDDINRYFNNMRSKPAANQERNWAPAVDIREEENRYLLSADIPGVNRENIDITLENGVLTLKGDRTGENGTNGKEYRRKERVHGTFMRQFSLPETVDMQNISATVKDGVLDVVIPKQVKPQPTRITIN
jgi:HSP20 family protein